MGFKHLDPDFLLKKRIRETESLLASLAKDIAKDRETLTTEILSYSMHMEILNRVADNMKVERREKKRLDTLKSRLKNPS